MNRNHLLASAAVVALVAVSSPAFAQSVVSNTIDIDQTSDNTGQIDNFGSIDTTGAVSGDLGSVSTRATGATAGVSVLNVNEEGTDVGIVADPTSVVATQSATNSGAVTNFTIDTLSVGDLSGDVTSLSGSASGATASVSVVNLGTTGGAANDGTNDVALGTTEGLGLTQSAINSGTVTNIGDDATTGADLTTGNLSGTMSSVRSSAIGASASVSVLNVNSLIEADTTIGSYTDAANSADISQTATNTGTVVNGVTDSQNTIAVTGDLSGDGASASSSASGASASVSVSNVWASDSTLPTAVDTNQTTTISSVTQTVTNGDDTGTDATIGAVSNYGSIAVDGSLSGVRTNAIVSATGASAGVSVANIGTATDGTPTVGAELDTTISPVSQTSSNYANVVNGTADDPSTVTIAGELSGTAAAASASATGAAASVSVSNILAADQVNLSESTIQLAAVTQSVSNAGAIVNYGTITTGALTGTASSVSASAVGASASISIVNISGIALPATP